jgi:6-phosphogluconolactonase
MPEPEVRILNNSADLFHAAAVEFAALASEAVLSKGTFTVALSGGSTPEGLYTLLANDVVPSIPWGRSCFFWGDERQVPPDHPDSNYRMAYEALLSKVPVRLQNVFRIHSEVRDADAVAVAYEQDLKTFFNLRPNEFPRFDLVLLGLGTDGHTASLFPETTALHEKDRLVVANWVDKFNAHRFTLTLPVLNKSACVMFLVSGQEKSEILREVLENPDADLPAQKVRPAEGRLLWLVDRAAASELSQRIKDGGQPS